MTRAEVRWALLWAVVVMLITCLPYLYVATLAPPGTIFSGLLCAADDHCVYLSWEQQAAQGHFWIRNLFTGDTQRGIYCHVLSWLIGSVARLTGAPLIPVHHAARVVLGVLTLLLAYRLFALFTPDLAMRRAAFWFTAFSAGFGWLCQRPGPIDQAAVDLWQPEAVTFLCLYANGLFCAALSLMIGIFLLLLTAEGKGGLARWGRVVGAGLLGLLLGNIHSYDVITVAGVWGAYVAVRAAAGRRFPGRALVDSLVAGLVALPSTLYQYYLYRTEPVFHMRAETRTLSAPLASHLVGYGLVLLLAAGAAVWLVRTTRRSGGALGQRLFPLTWAIVGFALPYLPCAFQRRFLLGLHLPLAFLAGVGAVALARAIDRRVWGGGSRSGPPGRRAAKPEAGPLSPRWVPGAVVAGLLLLTLPTNWCFIHRDLADAIAEASGHMDPLNVAVFFPKADLAALEWARRHLPPEALVLCSTGSGSLFPALAGRPVYVGHWSETPNANQRMLESLYFYRAPNLSPQDRRAFLQAHKIRYVYEGTAERLLGAVDLARDPLFCPIYNHDGAAIYEVQSQTLISAPSPPPARRPRSRSS